MEKSILLNTSVVNSILSGNRTMIRKPIKRVESNDSPSGYGFWKSYDSNTDTYYIKDYAHSPCWWPVDDYIKKFARYCIGDTIYVREAYADHWLPDGYCTSRYVYKTAGPPTWGYWGNENTGQFDMWIPSVCMPKSAARIFLEVTDVKLECLHAICAGDCKKEGIKLDFPITDVYTADEYIAAFKQSWDSEYHNWDSNPWVIAVEFKILSTSRSRRL